MKICYFIIGLYFEYVNKFFENLNIVCIFYLYIYTCVCYFGSLLMIDFFYGYVIIRVLNFNSKINRYIDIFLYIYIVNKGEYFMVL